ncbi:kielin/chordin-like protein [Mytilus trossulus]|uniref:kielin/chordin-like protein n=1 Tax=Mytilus trossulus TaxID=6551 RepID=UPI003004F0B6
MKILFVCFVFGLGIAGVLGRRCVVYSAGEIIPAIPKGARYGRTCHSVLFDPKRYCIEWDCPQTDCSNPIIPYSGCPYCQGTCVSDGNVYQYGVSFPCDGGCNTCTCFMSTMRACFKNKPPAECL